MARVGVSFHPGQEVTESGVYECDASDSYRCSVNVKGHRFPPLPDGWLLKNTTAAAEALHGVSKAAPGVEISKPQSQQLLTKRNDPERSASVRVIWLGSPSESPALSRVQPDGSQRGRKLKQRRAVVIPNKCRRICTFSLNAPGSWSGGRQPGVHDFRHSRQRLDPLVSGWS